jgi:predicted ATP-dependent endonuclease of OLD family
MLLKRLSLENFRCFEKIDFDSLDSLAIFIGENDAGKTVLLDAISLLVENRSCVDSDCRKLRNGSLADRVVLEGWFQLDSHDTLPEEHRSGECKDLLYLKKCFAYGATEIYINGQGYDDERFDSFVGAENQKTLLREFELSPANREPERKTQREQLVEEGKLRYVEKEFQIAQFSPIAKHMPRVDRVASYDYKSPESMIQRTLQSVAASVVNPPDEEGNPQELEALQQVRVQIEQRLNEEIAKAKTTLQTAHQKLEDVVVEPVIDFSKSVATNNLHLAIGDEDHRSIDFFGEGTKKRIWMGLLEWERGATSGEVSQSVIRLYDEPDVNLHYEAQRQLFSNISKLASGSDTRTQCFVCTHSVTLVDNAPSNSINLIRIEEDGKRELHQIHGPSDEEVVAFFNEVARAVGLSNTALLQERGFLVVEGPSEADSIPIIYRNLFDCSMREDGLVPINLHACSAWKSVIEVLLSNRLEMIHILLDKDCQNSNSSAKITPDRFEELGCSEEFQGRQVSYIGDKEFEDAFSNEVIVRALNQKFPLPEDETWSVAKVQSIRAQGDKFSAELSKTVQTSCVKELRSDVSKPSIAKAIAEQCVSEADVPSVLLETLRSLRRRAGVDNS